MSPRKALGKGLDALIPTGGGAKPSGEMIYVEPSQIKPSSYQPRKKFDQKALEELAQSIREKGLLQPLLVRKGSNPESYQLIAGERRLRAVQLAGLDKVPVLVKEVNDKEALAMSLIENIQREDLNPIEEADAYQRLLAELKMTQEQLSEVVGKDRSTIANAIRLLKLPKEIQAEIEKGAISSGHARAILQMDSPAKMKLFFNQIIQQGLSVRQAETLAKQFSEDKKSTAKKPSKENQLFIAELERRLSRVLSAKVKLIEKSKNRGKIEVYYQNLEELERIIDLVSGKK